VSLFATLDPLEKECYGYSVTTKIPSGSRAYAVGSPPVDAEGVAFSAADLDLALTQRLPQIPSDSAGTRQIQDLLGGVTNTAFVADNLRAALKPARTVYDWQAGVSRRSVFAKPDAPTLLLPNSLSQRQRPRLDSTRHVAKSRTGNCYAHCE